MLGFNLKRWVSQELNPSYALPQIPLAFSRRAAAEMQRRVERVVAGALGAKAGLMGEPSSGFLIENIVPGLGWGWGVVCSCQAQ